jgi:hypothetical protein
MTRRRQAIFAAAILIGVGNSLAIAAPTRSYSPSAPSSSSQTGVMPAEEKLDTTPKPYENAKHKLKISAPAYWKPYVGGNSPDILFCFTVPPDHSTIKSTPRQRGERIVLYSDDFRFETSPLIDVKATPDALAENAKATIKNENAEAAFKPVEKLKVGGVDGVAVTATINGEAQDEPKVIVRHILFARDGLLFDMELRSHPYSIVKSGAQMLAVARSVQVAAPPASAESLTKLYEYKAQSLQFTGPSGWTSAIACHDFTCSGSYAAFEIPTDRSTLPPRKPGVQRIIHPSGIILAAAPAKDPKATLDAAVEEVKATAKAQDPTIEFKSAEKAKVGGVDAVLLTTTSAGEKAHQEPQRVQRRFVVLLDGKIHQLMHASHDYSVKKETPLVDAIFATVKFGAIAPAASGGTTYTFKEQNLSYALPANWTVSKQPAAHALHTLEGRLPKAASGAEMAWLQVYVDRGRPPETVVKEFTEKRKAMVQFEAVASTKQLGVAGEPAQLLRGTGLGELKDNRSLLIATQHGDASYLFVFQTSSPDLIPALRTQANDILKSVTWLDGAAPAEASAGAQAAPAVSPAAPKAGKGDGLD